MSETPAIVTYPHNNNSSLDYSGGSYTQQVVGTLQNGYICGACGISVNYGTVHSCCCQPGWLSNTPPSHQITRFCGTVEDLDHLPASARNGDCYFVEKAKALVVREQGGWFHYALKQALARPPSP